MDVERIIPKTGVAPRSLKFTSVQLIGDMRISATEYIRGPNMRSESRSCSGHSDTTPPTNIRYEYGPLRAHILNRDLNYRFEIEPATRTYTAFRVNEHGNMVWTQLRRAEPAKPSGKTVHNHIDTVDTGERRELFGYAARHVVTKTRQICDSEMLSESECDGWYIDPPEAWAKLHPTPKPGSFCYVTFGTAARDEYKFTEVGKRETGFALLTARTHKSSFRDEAGNLRTHVIVHRDEVTEFKEAPLEPDLFVPPPDFKRLAQLSDVVRHPLAYRIRAYRIRLRWERLKDSRSLPNRIAEFCASARS